MATTAGATVWSHPSPKDIMPSKSNNHRRQLQQLLRDLFEFESEDLDFGIYRVLRQRRERIEAFIENDLIDAAENVVSKLSETHRSEAAAKLEEQRRALEDAVGEDALTESGDVRPEYEGTPVAQRYQEARTELESAELADETEGQVYNDLHRFFSRYYDDGDFITARRFGSRQPKYSIPYQGEETLLHWATNDQYYIKSGERFTRYQFYIDDIRVQFQLMQADVPRENVQGEDRHFILADPPVEADLDNKHVVVRFEYRPLSDAEGKKIVDAYNTATGESLSDFSRFTNDKICLSLEAQLLNAVKTDEVAKLFTSSKDGEAPLQRHLRRYTSGHQKDYFIHQDLGEFFRRELDFYLKNEILDTYDLMQGNGQPTPRTLVRAQAVQTIAERVIAFLEQLEDFQRHLWEKKKFILETEYMVTLDHVPEELWDDILDNDVQIERWREIYQVEEWSEDLDWKGAFDAEFLAEHPALMIDTAHFGEEFKARLLASFDALDDEVDGVLIHGDNWHALNLLSKRFADEVDCVYIDPPYNSPSTEILYKNNYKHSSWLTLMENRLSLTRDVLSDRGVLITAIDENEQERLGLLLQRLFPEHRRTCVSVVHNPRGIQGANFSYCHDYAYFVYPRGGQYITPRKIPEDQWEYSNLRNWGGESKRKDGPNCFYPIYVLDGEIVEIGERPEDDFHPDQQYRELDDGRYEVWPIDQGDVERKWRYKPESFAEIQDTARVDVREDEIQIQIPQRTERYKTVWTGERYDAGTYGTRLLGNMVSGEFSFPKSLYTVKDSLQAVLGDRPSGLVLDFFAGSGTTGHAVMDLNREDGGQRKYVLVEMAEFFDEVLRPRLQKAAFARTWQDTVPQDKDGVSHLIKYHRIESYEDALDNVQLQKPGDEAVQAVLDGFEDYVPAYMLDLESRGSPTFLGDDALENPFDFTLQVRRGGYEPDTVRVDLPETFHYLIGARVFRLRRETHQGREYLITYAHMREGSQRVPVLTVWRDAEELDLGEEAKWLDKLIDESDAERVFVNSECLAELSEPIEVVMRENLQSKSNGS